jgi:signal peptide peptidase SppA
MAEPRWLASTVNEVISGIRLPIEAVEVAGPSGTEPVGVAVDAIAVIPIEGAMMKARSKYGGTSTVEVRRAVRSAVADPDIEGIMLIIDSPGGTVAGTEELASDIAQATQFKPVHAFIESFGASAAYWVASQADVISAGLTAQIGSLGTLAVVHDTSEAAKLEGVKVHVLGTGPLKGGLTPGSEVTDAHLEEIWGQVLGLNEFFMTGVAEGRGLDIGEVLKLADGGLHLASRAEELGLIDNVSSYDTARDGLVNEIAKRRTERSRSRLRGSRLNS